MTTASKAEVSLPSENEVRVSRCFLAPRGLVYHAYTTPELVKRWQLGPPGWSMPVCEMDVRAGGRFRWRWRNDENGQEFGFHGEFREVTPPSRIVHTEFFDPGDVGGDMGDGAIITIEFTESDGVTTIVTLMKFNSKQSRDQAMSTGMSDGMEMSYQLLDRVLADG